MEECPNCRNPIGGSLKELRAERDRLMPFVTKNAELQRQYKQKEAELNDRQEAIEAKDNVLKQKEAELLSNELALDELLKDAKRPEEEFKKLEQENQRLKNKLTNEYEKYKQQEAEYISEIENLNQRNKEFKKEFQNQKELVKNLSISLKRTQSLKDKCELDLRDSKIDHDNLEYKHNILDKDFKRISRENANLTRENISNLAKIRGLETKNENLEGRIKKLKSEIKELGEDTAHKNVSKARIPVIHSQYPFKDLDVIHSLSENVTQMFQPPSNIVTLGHGPFPEYDFDSYLVNLDITPRYDGYPWIIVGRDGWDEEKLIELIEDNDFDEVVVLSQELFVAGIISTHDPFSLPEDILMKFADGHPALEFLVNSGFEWPEIFIDVLDEPRYLNGPRDFSDCIKESPIYKMGYKVGSSRGLPIQRRRNILENSYIGEIPRVGHDDYMNEWGRPRMTRRLWRMAHHLAGLVRSRKKNSQMIHAVAHWTEDLDWLEKAFYKNWMRFKWPKI